MTHIEKTYEIRAKPEVVFSYLDDVSQRSQHMMGMGRNFEFEILSDKPTGLGATYHWRGDTFGWKFEWTEVVSRYLENKEKAQHSIKGTKIDSGWILTPSDGGTVVHVTMDYELGDSWFARLIDTLFARRYCSSGPDSEYAHLKETLERRGDTGR